MFLPGLYPLYQKKVLYFPPTEVESFVVAEFLLCILKQIEEEPEVEDVSAAEKERRAEQIRNKIRSVGKVMVMMNTLRYTLVLFLLPS